MATSVVEICNAALSLVGEKQITNATLSSDTEAERQCSLIYPIIKDRLLRAHPWNFAESRTQLASLTATPDFEFTYYYKLPSNCIRALRLYGTDENFRAESGGKLATDASPCKLIYTAKIEDVSTFDSGFTYALIYALAAHLAVVLSANKGLSDQLKVEAERHLKEARQQDGQEGTPYNLRHSNAWNTFRNRRP